MVWLNSLQCRAKILIIGQISAGKITRCNFILFLYQTIVADRDTVAQLQYDYTSSMTTRQSKHVMNSNKKIESAFSSSHWSEGNAHSAETQPLKRPRFEPNFEVKHGFALEDVDMNDVVDEIYALEVIMVIT